MNRICALLNCILSGLGIIFSIVAGIIGILSLEKYKKQINYQHMHGSEYDVHVFAITVGAWVGAFIQMYFTAVAVSLLLHIQAKAKEVPAGEQIMERPVQMPGLYATGS